jgi:hypothetical protein
MADNVSLPASAGKAASDEVTYSGDSNAQVQLLRLVGVEGAEGSKTVIDAPFTFNTGYYTPSTLNPKNNWPATSVEEVFYSDPDGNLKVRGPFLTDEGSFRDDFTGTGLNTALPNNVVWDDTLSYITTSSGFRTYVRPGTYVRNSTEATADAGWTRVDFVDSDTLITLDTTYQGTSGTAAGEVSNWIPKTNGSGTSVTVGTSNLTIATGTTNGDYKFLYRLADFGPQVVQFLGVTVSQRIANQELGFGLRPDGQIPLESNALQTAGRHRAEILFDGTTNTTCKFVTSGNDSTNGTTTTTVTLPGGANTASANSYRIEAMRDRCTLYINNVWAASHTLHIPDPYVQEHIFIYGRNTGAAGGTTNIVVDAVSLANDNQLATYNPYVGAPVSCVSVGDIAHDSPEANSAPMKIGGKAVTALSTATMVAASDRVDSVWDIDGGQIVKMYCPFADILSERITITSGTSTALSTFGATASARNMITQITCYNDTTVNDFVDIRDGTAGTVLWTIPLPAKGGATIKFDPPLRQPTANTALAYDVATGGSTIYLSFLGFKSKAG